MFEDLYESSDLQQANPSAEEFLSGYVQSFPQEELVAEGLNFLNPLTWFTRKAQAAIKEADKGGKQQFSKDTLSGQLLERRRMLAELKNRN